MKHSSGQCGFTLIEVLIAMFVLTIGIFALYSMQITALNTNARANSMTIASNWASDRVEGLLNRPYDCTPLRTNCHDLDDINGDGTNQDANDDGIDDDGGNFGLDNATAASVDGRAISPDGQYTVFWNVAIDTPVPDTKTIRVMVLSQERGTTHAIPITYIKYRG